MTVQMVLLAYLTGRYSVKSYESRDFPDNQANEVGCKKGGYLMLPYRECSH
jgi:hypothetical protein